MNGTHSAHDNNGANGPGGPGGPHDLGDLSAHALGLLSPAQSRAVEHHLDTCPACRQEWNELATTAAVFDQVPPEMFLDGPPENDLLLQRTLRQIRTDTGTQHTKRRFQLIAAAAVIAIALLGAGIVVGRTTAPDTTTTATAPTGQTIEGSEGPVTMTATITPAAGWIRVAAGVQGIPPGERCSLIVVGRDGSEHLAGSWVVGTPNPDAAPGTTLQGSTIIDPADVAAVTVRNDLGQDFITVRA